MSSSTSDSKGGKFTHKLYFDPRADQPPTDGYWITNKELREKLENLIDTEEKIKNASVYSNPIFPNQLTNWWLYHAFIIIETNDWWWSIEKNAKGITIQRSKNLESVRDMYQRKKRTTGSTWRTEIRKNKTTAGGNKKMKELIHCIWRKDCLNNVYHFFEANCQKFADMIFDRIKSYWEVYFDEAADQPRSSGNGCYMNVDQVFSEVQRLSTSETFTKLEIYKVPISYWKDGNFLLPGIYLPLSFLIVTPLAAPISIATSSLVLSIQLIFSHHYFVIFETDEKTYWLFARFETHYVILRASNKDILLKACQQNSPDILPSKAILEKSDVAVRQNMNAVLEFVWKGNRREKFEVPVAFCGQIARQIYDQFKRK